MGRNLSKSFPLRPGARIEMPEWAREVLLQDRNLYVVCTGDDQYAITDMVAHDEEALVLTIREEDRREDSVVIYEIDPRSIKRSIKAANGQYADSYMNL